MRFLKVVTGKRSSQRPLRSVMHGVVPSSANITANVANVEAGDLSAESDSDLEWLPSEYVQQNLSKRNCPFSRSKSLFDNNDVCLKELYKAGLYDFLRTNAGGNNSKQCAKITCHRLSTFIGWVVKFCAKSHDFSCMSTNPLLTVLELLIKNPQYVGEYIEYLDNQNASPSTKLTVLCQLKKCALWSMLFSPAGTNYDQNCFDKVCRNVYKACSKQNRIRIQERGNIDNLIKNKRWPPGGYAELREHVLKGGCDFMDGLFFSVTNGGVLKRSDYCRLLRVIITLMYLTSHQGRPNALKRLK